MIALALGPGTAGVARADEAPAAARTANAKPAAAPGRRGPHASPRSIAVPGFEILGDGSSRLFIDLTKPVLFDARVSRRAGHHAKEGTIIYVLKSARVTRRNNTNPLVTVHFNTPVTSARLVPHGRDLWFVVKLRADVQPAVTMDPGKDGSAVMRIELPKGNYLPPASHPAADPASPDSVAPSGR
ncbi:MAG: hypothetical protein ACREJ3_18425 [Polyangiaceae bacterium]